MYITVKLHHFLVYMYEMAAYNGEINPVMANGSNYGYIGTLIAAGKIDTVSFTTGADDPCSNCRNLLDGIYAMLRRLHIPPVPLWSCPQAPMAFA